MSSLGQYLDNLRRLDKFQTLSATVREGGTIYVGGILGSSYALLVSALETEAPGTFLFVVPRTSVAESALDDFRFFFPKKDIALFPPPDPYEDEDPRTHNLRLSLLTRFLHDSPPRVVVTPVDGLARPVWPRKALEKNSLQLRVGEEIDLKALEKWLKERSLHRVPLAESPGEWSRRGAIVDIYPFSAPKPFRIELFGDQVDSIREYNPTSQASVRKREQCLIIAIKSPTSYVARGQDLPPTLLDYLPRHSTLLFLDPDRSEARVNEIFQKTADAKLPLVYEKLLHAPGPPAKIFLTRMPKPADAIGVDFHLRSADRFSDLAGSFDTFLGALGEKKKRS